MPGYANWKQLYKEEFYALAEEGYDVSAACSPDLGAAQLPIPGGDTSAGDDTEAYWQSAYERLWAVREKGIRPDYPYVEPLTFEDVKKEMPTAPALAPLSEEEYLDRLTGAVRGRLAGVILGKPLEMGYSCQQVREYLESLDEYPLNDYVSGYSEKLDIRLREDCIYSTKNNVHFVQPDDDINYTWLAVRLLEKNGINFTPADVGWNWLKNIPYHWFWCASRQAYYKMVNLEESRPVDEQVAEIPWKLNPWRECIDGQIRTDLWGYISPGDPMRAAELAHRECSFSLVKNGAYGGMFVAGCIAAAMTKDPTVDTILDGGLSVIPKNCRLSEAIRQVREEYAACGDWESVCHNIEGRFANMPFAGTMNNLSMVTLSLLHGNLDYDKTITTAVMCGIDTDCNGGTAGSICGAAVGSAGVSARWTDPFENTIRTCLTEVGQTTVTEMIERIHALYRKYRS
ncbi:MAG: ADP-ribosylglycohydrolase family protein [Clostridia bacterium]|nr:ADP-ribosylglycohydrolase family protein [Clostridia bacterium]